MTRRQARGRARILKCVATPTVSTDPMPPSDCGPTKLVIGTVPSQPPNRDGLSVTAAKPTIRHALRSPPRSARGYDRLGRPTLVRAVTAKPWTASDARPSAGTIGSRIRCLGWSSRLPHAAVCIRVTRIRVLGAQARPDLQRQPRHAAYPRTPLIGLQRFHHPVAGRVSPAFHRNAATSAPLGERRLRVSAGQGLAMERPARVPEAEAASGAGSCFDVAESVP